MCPINLSFEEYTMPFMLLYCESTTKLQFPTQHLVQLHMHLPCATNVISSVHEAWRTKVLCCEQLYFVVLPT